MQVYKKRECCASCTSKNLRNILDLGIVPLAGNFPKKEELSEVETYPLALQFCEDCKLVQTDSVIDPDVLFRDYRYLSSIGLTDYFKGVAIEQGSETSFQDSLDTLSATLTGATTKVFNTIFSIFGGVISFFLVLVITFYFTVEEEGLKNFLKSVSPSRMHPYLFRLITRIQHKLGLWLKGQLILSLIIFGLVFIGLSIIGVEYALLLAFVAGVFEIIPFLGPTLAAIPAAFFGFTQSPVLGLLVIALYVLIQQLENHVIVPKVMSKSVGLNPLIVIVAFLVGAKIGGFIGVLLAVPVATAISVFLSDFFEKRIEKEVKLAK